MSAIGFRVKSGFAIAVVVDGPSDAPRPIARLVVELSDPNVHETRQPYHDGFYRTEENAREIARRVRIVKRCAERAIDRLLDGLQESQTPGRRTSRARRSTRAALVVGSVIDPATVGNPHIRAHASEGRLFRTVLEEALRSRGITCDVIVEKQLPARAAAALKRPASTVARTVAAFGKTLGGPWRAEEKSAATAAWIALC